MKRPTHPPRVSNVDDIVVRIDFSDYYALAAPELKVTFSWDHFRQPGENSNNNIIGNRTALKNIFSVIVLKTVFVHLQI